MKDGGGLTLTIPVDGEAVDRALVRLPPAQEIHFSDFVRCQGLLGSVPWLKDANAEDDSDKDRRRRRRRRRLRDSVPAP